MSLTVAFIGFSASTAGAENLESLRTSTESAHYSVDLKVDQDDEVSLLHWIKRRSAIQKPKQKYNRRLQFGTWRSIDRDGSCLDSRGLVLERDSQTRIATRQSAVGCSVVAGRWNDPYTGENFTVAQDVAIDHMVPLKNAYDNGAWRWPANKRCLYFNYQKNPYHLRAIGSRENASKSDSSPANYMPPLRSAQCEYLKNWLQIKVSWDLTMPLEEGDAIREQFHQAGCKESDFMVKQTELQTMREEIKSASLTCDFAKVGQSQ